MTRPVVVPVRQGTPEWLAWRRGGYGSSDVPTLLSGQERAWQRLHGIKLNLLDDPDATEPMEWGKDLEPAIARAYAKRTGEPVQKVPYGLQHPELPQVRASLDRRRRRGRVVVELKAWSWKSEDFGPDGSDQVPESMYAQVQQQLLVTGWDHADLAVFFGTAKRLEVFQIGRDQALIDTMVAIETAAWAYVARGEMPPWPGPAELRPILKADEVEPDAELLELVAAHELAQATLDDDTKLLEAVRNRLRMRLAEVGGTRGALPDGRAFSVSHRPEKLRTRTDWEHVAAGYRRRLLELGVTEAELDFPVTALTTTEALRRPLRVSIAKPKESTADAA